MKTRILIPLIKGFQFSNTKQIWRFSPSVFQIAVNSVKQHFLKLERRIPCFLQETMEQKTPSTSKNPDEVNEITDAALILLSMKHSKLDRETAFNLEATKNSFLGHPIKTSIHGNEIKNRFVGVENNRQRAVLPGPSMVESLQDIIGKQGGSVEKVVSKSDLNSDIQRLVLDRDKAKLMFEPFFTKREEIIFKEIDKLMVSVYDIEGRKYEMFYKMSRNTKFPTLCGCEWNKFCQDHGLKAGDFVKLLIFRHAKTQQFATFGIRKRSRAT